MRTAFSLVELSIVLVILGLLTGGILAGQSLIRAAELRSVSSEFQKYSAAIYSFRDKYFVPPGDMPTATKFWNRQTTDGWCVSNHGLLVAGSPGVCDGNGNGVILSAAAANQSGEEYQLWRHLAQAGLIEGSYTGLAGSTALDDLDRGLNVPASKLSNSIWRAYNIGAPPPASAFAVTYGNILVSGLSETGTALLRPDETWNIDTKMDDGRPAYGKIVARPWAGCTTAATQNDVAAEYDLDSTSPCLLISPQIF
jgi:prepilin-type N-terminal cleavage/methylation domain-containing protein